MGDRVRLSAAIRIERMNVGSRRNLPLVVFPHVRLLYLGTSRSRAVEPTSAPSAAQRPATDSFHRLRVRAADPLPSYSAES